MPLPLRGRPGQGSLGIWFCNLFARLVKVEDKPEGVAKESGHKTVVLPGSIHEANEGQPSASACETPANEAVVSPRATSMSDIESGRGIRIKEQRCFTRQKSCAQCCPFSFATGLVDRQGAPQTEGITLLIRWCSPRNGHCHGSNPPTKTDQYDQYVSRNAGVLYYGCICHLFVGTWSVDFIWF